MKDKDSEKGSIDEAGKKFLGELFRLFHNDRSYLDIDLPGEAAA